MRTCTKRPVGTPPAVKGAAVVVKPHQPVGVNAGNQNRIALAGKSTRRLRASLINFRSSPLAARLR